MSMPRFMPPAWVMLALLLVAILSGLAWVSQPASVPGGVLITQAQAKHHSLPAPVTVPLPHDMDRADWEGTAQYVITIPPQLADQAELGVFLSRVGARYRLGFGGEWLHSVHWQTPGYVDTSVAPQFVRLRMPQAGASELRIEVREQALRKSGLAAVLIGPVDAVQTRYDWVYAWQVQGTWMVAACSILVALLASLIWLQSRDAAAGLVAIAAIAWALRLTLTPIEQPHMPFGLWWWLHKLSFTVYCGCLYLFLWRLFGFAHGRFTQAVKALLWVAPFWLGATVLSGQYLMYQIWTGLITSLSVVTIVAMVVRARFGLEPNLRLMLVVAVATLVTGVRDFAVVQLGMKGDADMRWMTLGSVMFMAMLAYILMQRLASHVQEVKQLNEGLSVRVAEREAELRQAFESLREAEKREVLARERSRLTRDMHDGLGSQLVQALNLVRSQQTKQQALDPQSIASMLSNALEDLRITLDSLEPMEGDLPTILGTVRQRISPTLEAMGIELEWEVEEVPPVWVDGAPMESRAVMHLFRCVQEVVRAGCLAPWMTMTSWATTRR